jgi:predicted DsbA family dithiol-disulfide isomerase
MADIAACDVAGLASEIPAMAKTARDIPPAFPSKQMAKIFDTAATVLLVASALVMAGMTVRRESASRQVSPARGGPPTFVPDWRRFAAAGRWVGDSSARVKIVEFADFECPFCKRFHDRYRLVSDSMGRDVALLLVQNPLRIHRFAVPAALAADCADKQGRWEAFQDLLFDKQDSLGLKSWTSYARESGIADTVSFATCVKNTSKSTLIDAGLAAGKQIDIRGTPTVLINGWKYGVAPTDSLLAVVRERLRTTQ